jgi:hypothetical protein
MTIKKVSNKMKKSKSVPTVEFALPDGTVTTMTIKELGGFIVATYDFGSPDDNIDLTEAATGKDCTAVGRLFIEQVKGDNCFRPKK